MKLKLKYTFPTHTTDAQKLKVGKLAEWEHYQNPSCVLTTPTIKIKVWVSELAIMIIKFDTLHTFDRIAIHQDSRAKPTLGQKVHLQNREAAGHWGS